MKARNFIYYLLLALILLLHPSLNKDKGWVSDFQSIIYDSVQFSYKLKLDKQNKKQMKPDETIIVANR